MFRGTLAAAVGFCTLFLVSVAPGAIISQNMQILIDRNDGGAANSPGTYDGTKQTLHNNGGEFRVRSIPTGDPQVITFKTFCVEMTEFVNPGQTYYATFDDGAVLGGSSGTHDNPAITATDIADGDFYDSLSNVTKFLFAKYNESDLDLINFTGDANPDFTYNSDAWVKGLQEAIWWAENEMTSGFSAEASKIIAWVQNNQSTVDAQGSVANVHVMNLWTINTINDPLLNSLTPSGASYRHGLENYKVQSQLYYGSLPAPGVPEPVSLAVWSGMIGLGCVALKRRRQPSA